MWLSVSFALFEKGLIKVNYNVVDQNMSSPKMWSHDYWCSW